MGETNGAAAADGRAAGVKEIINWAAIAAMMVFYAGTWTFPWFYHVTEIYNTLIIAIILIVLFFNNIDWIQALRRGDKRLIALAAAVGAALVNLVVIGSRLGSILIIADFLLIWYLAANMSFTRAQMKALEIFFLLMFASWFVYDRAFSYNSNTGATVTVFTLFGAMALLTEAEEKREVFGYFTVISFVRTLMLVLWHLARGAFLALFLFILFYYFAPEALWRSKAAYRLLCIFVTLGSLVFVAFYVAVGSSGFNMQLPFFYKNIFSGREQIWLEVWDILKGSLLTGIGSGRALKSFFEYNIHNAMYDILAVHGIVVFGLSLFIILSGLFELPDRLSSCQDGAERRRARIAMSALFAIFIESFIDMDLMWADYSPLLLYLLMEAYGPGRGGSREKASEGK